MGATVNGRIALPTAHGVFDAAIDLGLGEWKDPADQFRRKGRFRLFGDGITRTQDPTNPTDGH